MFIQTLFGPAFFASYGLDHNMKGLFGHISMPFFLMVKNVVAIVEIELNMLKEI